MDHTKKSKGWGSVSKFLSLTSLLFVWSSSPFRAVQ